VWFYVGGAPPGFVRSRRGQESSALSLPPAQSCTGAGGDAALPGQLVRVHLRPRVLQSVCQQKRPVALIPTPRRVRASRTVAVIARHIHGSHSAHTRSTVSSAQCTLTALHCVRCTGGVLSESVPLPHAHADPWSTLIGWTATTALLLFVAREHLSGHVGLKHKQTPNDQSEGKHCTGCRAVWGLWHEPSVFSA
jgi:hypothetical protein